MKMTEYQNHLRTYTQPVVVDVWAPWCMPCRVTRPILKRLAQEYQGRVALWEVNAEEHPDLLRELRIYGIPTLIAYRDGQEVSRQLGAKSEAELRSLFQHLAEGKTPPRLQPLERLLRIMIALVLVGLVWFGVGGWPLLVLAGLIFFSAVYDRCPIWKAVTSWVRDVTAKRSTGRTP
ncbi:thioredoxin domain-containing protein [Chloroflexus aggregans]|uniref:Thioredoxin domain protein n=1 Tax=Chloroflexus aggregans (strain MD-66 / DSM 9485) TaxID=326427 RepID=B8G8B9_CHLAD|nr:thioredoxin domain-containing protein [Chloroflexus aggregans]ACL26173.1 Thioredoxin domain protein [Chloroflexus aggregans DSM 9485]